MSKIKKENKRLQFLNIIPSEVKRVLDVGCGNGFLSSKLREKGIEVVGIDRDEKALKEAKGRLSQVYPADIGNFQLPYPEGYFDCIMFADVLDCLIEPLSALKKYSYYLRNGGYMVASMANVRYYKVIIRLVFGGTWDYVEPGGILWKHHLRFFTLVNSRELFEEAGLQVIEIKRYIYAARGFRFLNFLCLNGLKDFLTYQYYIKACKKDNGLAPFARKRKIHHF